MSLNPRLCRWGFWSPKFRWLRTNRGALVVSGRPAPWSSGNIKNLFLCKLPIKNCIKWNQWLKVNCGIIKFVKSQTFFRIEITNDSWELIISILDSYHVDFLPISRRNFRSEIGLENSSKNQVVEKFLDIFRFFSIFSDHEWGGLLEKFSSSWPFFDFHGFRIQFMDFESNQ